MNRLAYVVGCLVAVVYFPFAASGDVVIVWNSSILEAIRNESTPPPLAARNLAILHASVFDAVNAIERRYEPYLFLPNPPPGASPEAAVVGAAYQSLISLFPSQQALFEQTLAQTLNTIPPGQSRDDGFALGQLVAIMTLAWRSSDGSTTTVPYIPGTAPGDWRRTPPDFRPPELPHWRYVVPFTMTNGYQFRPPGPPSLSSTQYTADFNLTKDFGAMNSAIRTPEQTLIARFWSDFSYTVTPPGHWNQIAQNVATNGTNTLMQNARAFALLNLALADAGIAAWDAKYHYNFWRPETAIGEADNDGNPDTVSDPDWKPLLTSPPFPEYTSGHSLFSSAAAKALALFYGTDQVAFTVESDSVPGVSRSFESFEAAAWEIGLSRIYGGIHFWSADLDGLAAGSQLSEFVFRHYLRPNPAPASLTIQTIEDNQIRITLNGTPERAYVLESSEDLKRWTPARTNLPPFSYEELTGPASQPRFFRGLPLP